MIEASSNISIKYMFCIISDGIEDGPDGIMGGTSRAESVTVWLENGLPFWFEGQFGETLFRAIEHGRNP